MKNAYQQIGMLYLRNRVFLILAVTFWIMALTSKVLIHSGYGYFGEEIFTLLFVVAVWLSFHLGLLLKRQFSTHRSSLLPGYRKPHFYVVAFIYALFVMTACLWKFGLRPLFPVTPSGLWGIYMTCLLMAVFITYVGYLSMGRVLMYAYAVILLLSTQSFNILSFLNEAEYLPYVLGLLCLLFVLFFRKRLGILKEDCFEYGHIFSWPPRYFIKDQMEAGKRLEDIFTAWKKPGFARQKIITIPQYARTNNIFLRAYHWDRTEHTDFKAIWILILLLTPLFLWLTTKQQLGEDFSWDVYSNFLLLAVGPVLVTMGGNFKRIANWGYDLIKPVRKQRYMQEQAIVLLTNLFLYWLLFSICIAILPSIIFQPGVFMNPKFWAYLGLTGTVSFLVFCWLAFLSCVVDPTRVILNGIVLSVIVIFYFYTVPVLSFNVILSQALICTALWIMLLIQAYRAWCEKEFLD